MRITDLGGETATTRQESCSPTIALATDAGLLFRRQWPPHLVHSRPAPRPARPRQAAGGSPRKGALDRDRAYVTPGLGNALSAHLLPRRPRTLLAAVAERVTRKVLDTSDTAQQPKTPAA